MLACALAVPFKLHITANGLRVRERCDVVTWCGVVSAVSRQLRNLLVMFWCYPCVLWKNLLALSAGTTFKLCHTANTKGDKQGAASDTKEEKRGAAAEADVGGNFIPVIKPEDLPKGISRLVCLSMD